jgi:hypothetical protein
MAARELARKSGLEYALMTGGDVAPLGTQAVTKIHQLFDWASKSRKGLLLFIDEADAFLCERNNTHMSEAQRSALNALLYRTGDQSRDIVLALATNRLGDLDSAITDRIDEVLEFPFPGEEERVKLLKLYLDKYIAQAGDNRTGLASLLKGKQKKIEIKGLSEDVIREAAAKTEGYCTQSYSECYRNVPDLNTDSSDCEILEATHGPEVKTNWKDVEFECMNVGQAPKEHGTQMLTQALQANTIKCTSSAMNPPISSIPTVRPTAPVGMPSTKVAYRSLLADVVQPDVVKELCKLLVIVSGEAAKTCAEEKCLQDEDADKQTQEGNYLGQNKHSKQGTPGS